jgi:hypothetical protein
VGQVFDCDSLAVVADLELHLSVAGLPADCDLALRRCVSERVLEQVVERACYKLPIDRHEEAGVPDCKPDDDADQSNSVALGSSPRAHCALVDCGLWAGTECRASWKHLTPFGTWERLGLFPHPQPLAEGPPQQPGQPEASSCWRAARPATRWRCLRLAVTYTFYFERHANQPIPAKTDHANGPPHQPLNPHNHNARAAQTAQEPKTMPGDRIGPRP